MSTSYPYLAVARRHNVPYADVLLLSDRLDDNSDGLQDLIMGERYEDWEQDTMSAWSAERIRRWVSK